MQLSDFDFDLPEGLIALRPVRPRPASRLLVAQGAATHDSHVRDLDRWLRPGDLLVFNDTRVIPARLFGERRRASRDGEGIARIEATLIHRDTPDTWSALVRPARRLRPGDVIRFGESLSAEVTTTPAEGQTRLRFDRAGDALDAAIAATGVMPLPPYIAQKRPADAQDTEDYQTIFARHPGSVAAPTAALHFDEDLLARLDAAGVLSARVTLHVGAGTFLPVKTEAIADHRMHAEWGEIGPEAAEAITAARAAGGRIIPVGTTALRLIESAAAADGRLGPWRGETAIFITPGYRFRLADGLMTNFHLPKSTLFMLVSALMGLPRMQALYAHAIAHGYRFFSYGDGSLLMPEGR
ncbi:MAG: tRNA preQ1(34) S-adenosylmethionine ribosyltransferase-isomerase QueA [Thermohalobaculum sp.]|nr:tRNA preQ1(34) S-adenosylmethionine ribosyltransferase-isomerase QueA [Thermohalobaculum sp.]